MRILPPWIILERNRGKDLSEKQNCSDPFGDYWLIFLNRYMYSCLVYKWKKKKKKKRQRKGKRNSLLSGNGNGNVTEKKNMKRERDSKVCR